MSKSSVSCGGHVFALNATCLVVSHRPFVIERADQVIHLEPLA
jgi:ABC-type multidrug transport system fused ATPase/permease subunit